MANNSSLNQVVADAVASLGTRSLTPEFVDLADQLRRLQTVSQASSQIVQANTQALDKSRVSGQPTSTGNAVADAFRFVGGGLGISPILTGLVRLFSGGGDANSESTALTKFTLPPPLEVVAGQLGGNQGPVAVDYGQGNVPRPIVNNSPQVTIQIQALDSKSILDRSQDIAQAVRVAMLESGVLTDLVREA